MLEDPTTATMVAEGHTKADSDAITAAIIDDERIPFELAEIKLDDLPVFRQWQIAYRLYALKEIDAAQAIEMGMRPIEKDDQNG